MLLPAPSWLDSGNNAWQLAAATFVALQSIPGLVVLYGGIVKKKWAINSAFMAIYAFVAVMVVWCLFDFNMAFGPHWLGIKGNYFVGKPFPVLPASFEIGQANIPDAAAGMPALTFPNSTMVYFQFVFAAITVIILEGSIIGRMSFKAWVLFCPLWMTFSYTIGAFSLWGGGWLAQMGVVDFSGGYVIHLAAAVSGFTAAAIIGPRIPRDRHSFEPNSLLVTLTGAGILWLGWNGFNGGDPYFANADAAAAVLNTNIATAFAVLTWVALDSIAYKKPSVIGAVNGMIAGLVGITPAAGYVNGYGAIIVGLVAGSLPWLSMNKFAKTAIMKKVDDCLGVFHTHGVAAVCGGLLTGLLADPKMIEYVGTGSDAPGISTTGGIHQLTLQVYGALFIIVVNFIVTVILLNVIKLVTPLRLSPAVLEIGDDAAHGEEAYAIFGEGSRVPEPPVEPAE